MDCSQITGPLCGNYGSPNRTLMPIFWYQKMIFWDQKFDFLREYSSSFLWIPNTKGQCEWYRDLMVALLLFLTSQWRHNGRDDVSNHQPHDCLLNRIFRHRWKKHQSSASLAFGKFSGDRLLPRTKGQWRGKCFHLMTSSWISCVTYNRMAGEWNARSPT